MRSTCIFILMCSCKAFAVAPPPGAILLPMEFERSEFEITCELGNEPLNEVCLDIGFNSTLLTSPELVEPVGNAAANPVYKFKQAAIRRPKDFKLVASSMQVGSLYRGMFAVPTKPRFCAGVSVDFIVRKHDNSPWLVARVKRFYVLPSRLDVFISGDVGSTAEKRFGRSAIKVERSHIDGNMRRMVDQFDAARKNLGVAGANPEEAYIREQQSDAVALELIGEYGEVIEATGAMFIRMYVGKKSLQVFDGLPVNGGFWKDDR